MTSLTIYSHSSLSRNVNLNESSGNRGCTSQGRTIQQSPTIFTSLLGKMSALFTRRSPHDSHRGREATVSTPSAPEQQLALRNQKSAAALLDLGVRYDRGQGVPQSTPMAVACYRTAAGNGLAQAQYQLAKAYEVGQGVEQDLQAARNLYQKAADQNLPEAKAKLASIQETPQHIPPGEMSQISVPTRAAPPPPPASKAIGQNVPHEQASRSEEVQSIPTPPPLPPAVNAPKQNVTPKQSSRAEIVNPSQVPQHDRTIAQQDQTISQPIPPILEPRNALLQEIKVGIKLKKTPLPLTPTLEPQDALLQEIRRGIKLKKTDPPQGVSQTTVPANPSTEPGWQSLSNRIPAMNPPSSPGEPMNTEWDEPLPSNLKTTMPVKPPILPKPIQPLVTAQQQGKPQSNTTPRIKAEPLTGQQSTPELTSRNALPEQIREGIKLKPTPSRKQPPQADNPSTKALHAALSNRRRVITEED